MPIATKALQFYLRGAEYERMRDVVEHLVVVRPGHKGEGPCFKTLDSTRHIGRPHHHHHRHNHYHRDGTVKSSTVSTTHSLERRWLEEMKPDGTQAEASRRLQRKWKRVTILLRNGRMVPIGGADNEESFRVSESFRASEAEAAPPSPCWPASKPVVPEAPSWLRGSKDCAFLQRALELRARLRNHRSIELELQRWWDTALCSASDEERAKGVLWRESYIELACKMAKAILKVFSQVDATVSAELDWAADVGDASALPSPGFKDSLFALVDAWTRSTTVE